jgi:hypothetical protein
VIDMKKLNNKGNTLIELIISIALMSVVLVSMVRLLVDLNNTNTNSVYAKNNEVVRSEIIRAIETDLNNYKLSNINDLSNEESAGAVKINLIFKGRHAIITAKKNTIVYKSVDGKVRRWTMKDCEVYTDKANLIFSVDEKKNIFTLQIDIEIHTNNDKNTTGYNNLLDDILISYYGHISDLNGAFLNTKYATTSNPCLGKSC